MLQGFKQFLIQLRSDHWLCILLCLYCVFMLIYWPIGIALALLIIFLEPIRSSGILPGTRKIGINFYAFKNLNGIWYISQRRRSSSVTCREVKKSYLLDKHMATFNFPSGKYKTITHEVVFHCIEKIPKVKIVKKKIVYKHDLKPILNAVTHNKCRHCIKPCAAFKMQQRPFYEVIFEVN